MSNETVRVACAQFSSGINLNENLDRALRMIDKAANIGADLVVLPEFINHLSWYESAEHCFEVSVEMDGEFVGELKTKAKALRLHLVANVTLKKGSNHVTGSSLLINPEGNVLSHSCKQVLMGHENDFLCPAEEETPIVSTPLGEIGLYSCMDGVIQETPRSLALRGGEILCNSLNSFAFDEASLHVPIRAVENKCFVVAANKVGPLIPEQQLEAVGKAINIPPHFLYGAGESQIVSPDGTVMACASIRDEEVIFADIQPAFARNKQRPDGTHIFSSRRPDVYGSLAENISCDQGRTEAKPAVVGVWQPTERSLSNLDHFMTQLRKADARGINFCVVPERFSIDPSASMDEALRHTRQSFGR